MGLWCIEGVLDALDSFLQCKKELNLGPRNWSALMERLSKWWCGRMLIIWWWRRWRWSWSYWCWGWLMGMRDSKIDYPYSFCCLKKLHINILALCWWYILLSFWWFKHGMVILLCHLKVLKVFACVGSCAFIRILFVTIFFFLMSNSICYNKLRSALMWAVPRLHGTVAPWCAMSHFKHWLMGNE